MSFDLKPVNITRTEEIELLSIIRETERAKVADPETGATRTNYFPTAAQADAVARLVASYENAITHAALKAKTISKDDAEQIGREVVMRLAYESKITNDRLAGAVVREIRNEIMKADGHNAPLAIPHESRRVYMGLVAEHGSVSAAWDAVKAGGVGMSPYTFYALYRALNADSVEAIRFVGEEGEDFSAFAPVDGSSVPSPEDIILGREVAEEVRALFDLVDPEQALVLRLAYGFMTREATFVRSNSSLGDNVTPSDREISEALAAAADVLARTGSQALYPEVKPKSRATVQRRHEAGLAIMRAAWAASIADDVSSN